MDVKAQPFDRDDHRKSKFRTKDTAMKRPTTAPSWQGAAVLSASLDWYGVLSRVGEIWWTRSAGRQRIAAARSRRLAELVRFARARSPFYRDAWQALPEGDTALRELPVVTKRQLMERFDDWLTDRAVTRAAVDAFVCDRERIGDYFLDRFIVWRSSGSTGEPGIFVQDEAALATYQALLIVQLQSTANAAGKYAWSVLTQGGRAALVTATGDHFASVASWQHACRTMPWSNARSFSIMEPLQKLVGQLNHYQPTFLASYPTTLATLAREQAAGRLRIAPSCVWSGGEHLADCTRAEIEAAFGPALINEYGASECLSMACSCRAGALHVNADWVILEPVDRDYRPTPPGEPSHTVLLTNLANRLQPIIRYDLGDSVTIGVDPCRCGNKLPVIRVEGRRDDVLALDTADGSTVRLSPLALTTVVEDALPSQRFQLVQNAPAEIAVRLDAAQAGEREARWNTVKCALEAYLAQQSLANVRVMLDSRVPVPDKNSGKLREVIADTPAHAHAH